MTTPRRSITILGAGHIGFAMALLLSRSGDYEVLVADRDPLRLHAVAALGVATETAVFKGTSALPRPLVRGDEFRVNIVS